MPHPRQLPDNEVLVRLRNQGWTYDDIANEYGVTRGAVYLRLRQVHATQDRPDYKSFLPWTVAREHTHTFPAQMLRLLGRLAQGGEVPDVKARMLDKWLRDVREANVVVCYDREYPPNPASPVAGGFYYSRRRSGEPGDALIRTDEGAYNPEKPPSKPKVRSHRAK